MQFNIHTKEGLIAAQEFLLKTLDYIISMTEDLSLDLTKLQSELINDTSHSIDPMRLIEILDNLKNMYPYNMVINQIEFVQFVPSLSPAQSLDPATPSDLCLSCTYSKQTTGFYKLFSPGSLPSSNSSQMLSPISIDPHRFLSISPLTPPAHLFQNSLANNNITIQMDTVYPENLAAANTPRNRMT